MRQFAVEVVEKLQSAGYQALWAGGCVRDQLLGLTPKDYDVATDATPEQIRELFTHRRTLAIGISFGVITVLGPKSAGPIEVATFRRDAGYSDGRRPDSVEFTDAREDAIRRDFTINGMFFDPIAETVIDYVDGQTDLKRKRIRAIGDPHARIREDKLRMLRGIRFASTFGFEIEPETWHAIWNHAPEIKVVSAERIGTELTRMLVHYHRFDAARWLVESKLLDEILPQNWTPVTDIKPADWRHCFWELQKLDSNSVEPAIYLLVRSWLEQDHQDVVELASQIQSAWRLTNQQRNTLVWIRKNWQTLTQADSQPWSVIQPLLIQPGVHHALAVAEAILDEPSAGIKFCRERLEWPEGQLNPTPLLLGKDLIDMGIRPGPEFKTILQSIRDRQLDNQIDSVDKARKFVEAQMQ